MKKNEGKRRRCEEQHGGGALPQLSPSGGGSSVTAKAQRQRKCAISFITLISEERSLNMQNPVRLYITGDIKGLRACKNSS